LAASATLPTALWSGAVYGPGALRVTAISVVALCRTAAALNQLNFTVDI